MLVRELMKTHVVKTEADATLAETLDLMDLYQANELPVTDKNGCLVGMITEGDILRAARTGVSGDSAIRHEAGREQVATWMKAPVTSVSEVASAQEAANLLIASGMKRLPVLSEMGQIVGTLNRIDVLQASFEGNL